MPETKEGIFVVNGREFHKYEDVIRRQHPTSKKHPRMSNMNRAAQFAPFVALTDYEESIEETARLTDSRAELGEDEITEINDCLNFIQEHVKERPEVTITYFQPDEKKEGGEYIIATGKVRIIDEINKIVEFENKIKINMFNIVNIYVPLPNNC